MNDTVLPFFSKNYSKSHDNLVSFCLVSGYSVNGNGLLEFRVSPETGQAGQEFTVRAATLWLKADVRRPRTSRCKSTEIYVFKFISSISRSVKLSSQVSIPEPPGKKPIRNKHIEKWSAPKTT